MPPFLDKMRGMTVNIDGKTYRITAVEVRDHVLGKWRKVDLNDPQVRDVATRCALLFRQVNPGSGKTLSFSFDMTTTGVFSKQYHVHLTQIKYDGKTHEVPEADRDRLCLHTNPLTIHFLHFLAGVKGAPVPLPRTAPSPIKPPIVVSDDESDEYIYLKGPPHDLPKVEEVRGDEPENLPEVSPWANAVANKAIPVGILGAQWQFPSDHVPVGIEESGIRFASWNVLENKAMHWITDENTQGLKGSMITDLHSKDKLTLRDRKVRDLTVEMCSRVDIIGEQECSTEYLNHLEENLPPNWGVIKNEDGQAILYNGNKFKCLSSQSIPNTMPSAKGTHAVQLVTFLNNETHQVFSVMNAHIPGNPTLPARQEFANYVKGIVGTGKTTVVLGDNNFTRAEMLTAYQNTGLNNFKLHSPWNTNVSTDKSSKCIDHILVRNGINSRNLGPEELMSNESQLKKTIQLLNP